MCCAACVPLLLSIRSSHMCRNTAVQAVKICVSPQRRANRPLWRSRFQVSLPQTAHALEDLPHRSTAVLAERM